MLFFYLLNTREGKHGNNISIKGLTVLQNNKSTYMRVASTTEGKYINYPPSSQCFGTDMVY